MTDATPETKAQTDPSLGEKTRRAAATAQQSVKDAASSAAKTVKNAAVGAQEKASSATSATVDAAKEHPYAAAGIVAGVAAAVAGGAYAASKLGDANKAKPGDPAKKPAAKKPAAKK